MRLISIGDNVVDRYLAQKVMYPGGNAVNVAVFARRCGADTGYIGVLGDDAAGDLVWRALTVNGVDTSHTRRAPGINAFAMVELRGGDRVFVASSKGVSVFTPTSHDLKFAATADVIHTSHASSLEDHVATLASLAPVSFDFSYRHEPDYLHRVLPHVTFAHFSAGHLNDTEVADLATRAAAYQPRHLLITRGALGAEYWQDGHHFHQPARDVRVVDTLGAGDAFIASLLVDTAAGISAEDVLARAADRSAIVCQTHGAFDMARSIEDPTAASEAPPLDSHQPAPTTPDRRLA